MVPLSKGMYLVFAKRRTQTLTSHSTASMTPRIELSNPMWRMGSWFANETDMLSVPHNWARICRRNLRVHPPTSSVSCEGGSSALSRAEQIASEVDTSKVVDQREWKDRLILGNEPELLRSLFLEVLALCQRLQQRAPP